MGEKFHITTRGRAFTLIAETRDVNAFSIRFRRSLHEDFFRDSEYIGIVIKIFILVLIVKFRMPEVLYKMRKSESLERSSLLFIGLAIGVVAGAIAIVKIPEPLSGYIALLAAFSFLVVAFLCSMKSIDAASEEARKHWRLNAEYWQREQKPWVGGNPEPETFTLPLQAPPPPPKAPPAHTMDLLGNQYETHTADDNKTITAVYCNGVLMEPRPKPRWWQFWRWFETDPYRRW